jgi:hypothetical protein
MELHYTNDPQHHMYYRQGTNRDELTLKTEKFTGEESEKKIRKKKRLRICESVQLNLHNCCSNRLTKTFLKQELLVQHQVCYP